MKLLIHLSFIIVMSLSSSSLFAIKKIISDDDNLFKFKSSLILPLNLDSTANRAGNWAQFDSVRVSIAHGGRLYGVVRDALTGDGIGNVEVKVSYSRGPARHVATLYTLRDGSYASHFLRPGPYKVSFVKDGYIEVENMGVWLEAQYESQLNTSLTPPVPEDQYRITMSWTSIKDFAVRDVDSYLQIPGVSRPLNYNNRNIDYNGAFLDRDDTDWIGPETVTIKNLNPVGTYIYYVNNYNSRRDLKALGQSEVRAVLFKGSRQIKAFELPPGGEAISYEFFRIIDGEILFTEKYDEDEELYYD